MSVSEPMTLATDYLLAGVSAWLGSRLYRSRLPSRRWWAAAFGALALAAFLGGTWHGFVRDPILWKATLLCAGLASFAMIGATAYATLSGNARTALFWLAGLKLVLYSYWVLRRSDFVFVIADTGIALLVVAVLHAWKFNGPILAGVALSVAGALVQASGFSLHPHFNHNDLYHVIQVAAMFLLYRGAQRLRDAAAPTPAPRQA